MGGLKSGLALGALWLVIWQGRGRWLGLPAMAVAVALWSGAERPFALVSQTGGLIGAVTWAPVVRWDQRPTLDDYLDHLDHLVKVGGIEHVAFASDLPEDIGQTKADWEKLWGPNGVYPNVTGVLGDWYTYEDRSTEGMETISQTPLVWDKMRARGYHESDIEKVMSGNWLRVLGDVWKN